MTTYDSFAIFPAINVARVGNAVPEDDNDTNYYYVGSEIPGVYVGKGNPSFEFKDSNGRIKPQAARFRIYGYDKKGKNLGEIKSSDEVKIKWTVQLANKKAANMGFFGIKNQDQKGPIRNADWPYDRSTLEAIPEPQTLESGDSQNSKDFTAQVYRNGQNKGGQALCLGKMIMEKEGSLLIIGGRGDSGCVKETLITDYANNDYWYDDTSDGFINAEVTINSQPIKSKAGPSWVLVTPPKYAPGIPNLVSLYQVILETQSPVDKDDPVIDPTAKDCYVEYYRDIRPIFKTVCRNSWVNEKAFRGHGPDKPGNFLNPQLENKLKNSQDEYKDLRGSILSRARVPAELASTFEYNGQAYDYFMPPLSGDAGDVSPGDPDTYLTITPGQYYLLKKWADGIFNEGNLLPEYNYNDDVKNNNDSRKPTYSDESGNDIYDFQEMVDKILNDQQDGSDRCEAQVKFLNKAALEWCVGGPFFPGIEMTYLAYDKKTFQTINKQDIRTYFRINSDVIKPGDINKHMALPWQADFSECNIHWWPAQRPDITIPEAEMGNYKNVGDLQFVEWTRGFRNDEPSDSPKWGDMDMVRLWNRLGFIVEKPISNNISAFVEIERGSIYVHNSKNISDNVFTLDNLYSLLIIALQIELSTIPPYLYAMYSIKPTTTIDDMNYTINPGTNNNNINDMITYKIRHVAAEEMLHASLVANLIAAIGRNPVFYSPEIIPFYPNPLPHIEQGLLMVHLSKADEKNFDTFIRIEEPFDPSLPQLPRIPRRFPSHIGLPLDFPINVDSIGQLYQLIKRFFEKLNDTIEYDTEFQLNPGMGYAPSTINAGKDGLIVVDSLEKANRAIDLIIDQGEGKPCKVEMIITQGSFDGNISGEARVEEDEIIIEGMIEGNIVGPVERKENGKSKETGTIEGRIEKAKIQGKVKRAIIKGNIGGAKLLNFSKKKNHGSIKNSDKVNVTIIEGIINGVTKFKSEGDRTIERIIEGGNFEVNFEDIGEGIKFEKSIQVTFNNGNIEEDSHYNTFRICKIYVKNACESEYRLWPVIDDPNVSFYIDPKIIATATAFNAAYSYLMLLLQNVWRTNKQDEEEKKELVIGGMPVLMHGVLRPIAVFLAATPISSDTNAGATFGYYEFTGKSSVRSQLIAVVQEAFKAFPDSDELKTAANVVTSLPDISLTI